MKEPEGGAAVRRNPARLARPKTPKPYQSESVKALSDEEVGVLVTSLRKRAQAGDVAGKVEGCHPPVVTELKNRGVSDTCIACVDGLKGFPETINVRILARHTKVIIQDHLPWLLRHVHKSPFSFQVDCLTAGVRLRVSLF